MRTPETTNLPIAYAVYEISNEQSMRSTAEKAFDDLRMDVIDNRDFRHRPASLAIRRHQFLLMGASHG
jgi:hypothetical protein